MKIPPYPSVADYPEWQRTVVYSVCSASGRGKEAAPWISEVFKEGCKPDDFAHCAVAYDSLDAKLAHALRSIVRGDLQRRIGTATDRLVRQGSLMTGRSMLRMIVEEFRPNKRMADADSAADVLFLRCASSEGGP